MVSPGKGIPALSIIIKRITAGYPRIFRAFCKLCTVISAANGPPEKVNSRICKMSSQRITFPFRYRTLWFEIRSDENQIWSGNNYMPILSAVQPERNIGYPYLYKQ